MIATIKIKPIIKVFKKMLQFLNKSDSILKKFDISISKDKKLESTSSQTPSFLKLNSDDQKTVTPIEKVPKEYLSTINRTDNLKKHVVNNTTNIQKNLFSLKGQKFDPYLKFIKDGNEFHKWKLKQKQPTFTNPNAIPQNTDSNSIMEKLHKLPVENHILIPTHAVGPQFDGWKASLKDQSLEELNLLRIDISYKLAEMKLSKNSAAPIGRYEIFLKAVEKTITNKKTISVQKPNNTNKRK